jgi:hypothetical protein
MKIKDGFVLRQVADTWVVMPLGQQSLDFDGMLTLNDTGALLWQTLEKGGDREAMADALTAEYEVTRDAALRDVDIFLVKLQETGCVE